MGEIVALEVLDNYRVPLRFDDGVEGIVGFSAKPRTGVFAAWRDYEFFRRAQTIAWDGWKILPSRFVRGSPSAGGPPKS